MSIQEIYTDIIAPLLPVIATVLTGIVTITRVIKCMFVSGENTKRDVQAILKDWDEREKTYQNKIDAQQKALEEQNRQIQDLTLLVTKVVEKRVD